MENDMDDTNPSTEEMDVMEQDMLEENGLVFNPFNPVNVQITLNEVQSILTRYGLPPHVRNLALFQRAFVHKSYTKKPQMENEENNITIVPRPPDCLPLFQKHNERLEFVGDGLLEAITKLYLYKRFPKENEGFMTEKKIVLVKNESIGRVALEMGLHRWLIISKHAEEKKIRTNLRNLGCLFEAFIGALYLNFETHNPESDDTNDSCESPGFKMVRRFIISTFETHVDWVELIQTNDNYKNIIQVKIQKEFKVTPHYLTIERILDRGFHMGVYLCLGQPIYHLTHADSIPIHTFRSFRDIHEYVAVHNKVLIFMGEGIHNIKKKAEQMACYEAVQALTHF